jgi:hypothetical protein
MAQQIKNTFLKSKMNKDLDDRILPNGEYRDARNISVGRSEDNDVGALENIIGNNLVTGTDIGNGLTIIGVKPNNSTDQVFVFLTDYTDPNPFQPTDAPSTSNHYIYVYNNATGAYTSLVTGNFLNFSTTNRIIGINLLENLLFWTDNRNQPRKINIGLSGNQSSGSRVTSTEYYTQEHQISVAKYSPYQAIQLYNRLDVEIISGNVAYVNVSGDRVAEITPFIGATVVSSENSISGDEYVKITNVALVGSNTRISLSPNISSPTANTYFSFIMSTMTNKNDDTAWPGDPDFLEDRFVRFSYRFKYDDNEYSLMAPFTQIAYIPKQYGFFVSGDEDSAYQSTIVDFMENLVQNIGLVIPLPTNANRIVRDYKIAELEILFRESDSVAVKVLESITAGEISGASGISNYYTYDYQSRKPYKTLPEAQTTRVYDKVPVRAFSQESSGNRIIYGNYRDQHTPPSNINYNCRIAPKSDTGTFNNWIEYPNHSVKRNRNYQVGFILADKFGRQSPVLLSSVDNGINSDGQFYFGSTIYSPYDISETDTSVISWFGDAINVIVNSEIKSTKNLSSGTPGLYAVKQNAANSTAEGYAVEELGNVIVSDSEYTFRLDDAVGQFPNNINIPRINDYLRGAYEDFVLVTNISGPTGAQQQYTVTTSGRVNDVYLRADNLAANTADLKFAYTINDLGWYSYKVVVKQTEQEYYNVYLPGILNGYPLAQTSGSNTNPVGDYNGTFPSETNLTAFTTLFNDNINKIPRDLAEVGPEQKQFRSSVTLYGRVTNIMASSTASNEQYYARLSSQGKNAIAHTSTAIADAKEVNMAFVDITGPTPFYQIETNPLIARISTTEKSIGATYTSNGASTDMSPFLAIYETEPVESLLDIYWETTSEGLIVDLNADVLSGAGGATSFINVVWDFDETTVANDFVTTSFFEPVNSEGDPYSTAGTARLISQKDGNGVSVELFELFPGTGSNDGKYKIRFLGNNRGEPLVFDGTSRQIDVYTFVIEVTTDDGDVTEITLGGQVGGIGALKNIIPSFTDIPDFSTTKDTRVIIPPVGVAGRWTDANPLNGSANTNQNRFGLQYTLNRDSSASTVPDDWVMNISSGELTQPVDETPNGTYTATIRVTDANGDSSPNGSGTDYNQLYVEQNTNITIGYARVNTEALSTNCIVSPAAGADYTMSASANGSSVTGVWYLAESTTNLNLGEISNNTTNTFKINDTNGSHKSGTLVISSNVRQIANGSNSKGFKAGKTEFYYRFFGNTNWTKVPRSLEYNNAGLGSEIASVLNDAPGGLSGLTLSNSNLTKDTWLSNIRAFDYLDFEANGAGIEYAIVVKDLTKTVGATSNPVIGWVIADDLHYPQCVPWQGTEASRAEASYEYSRSPESTDRINTEDILTSNLLFAETPYGEYVNQFYTDTARTTAYLTQEGTSYINFRLKTNGLTPPWTKIGGQGVDLSWSAGFGSADGVRLIYSNPTAGVNSVQTTVDINDTSGLYATSRIKTDN